MLECIGSTPAAQITGDLFMHLLGLTLSIPVFLLVYAPLIGFIRLFSLFGLLSTLPLFALGIGCLYGFKTGKKKLIPILALTAALTQALFFASWILSRRTMPTNASTHTWSGLPSETSAGFPVRALEIPPAPMGNDHVPMETWSGIFINQGFWLAIGLCLSLLIVRSWPRVLSIPRLPFILLFLACLGNLYTLALLTLWYD